MRPRVTFSEWIFKRLVLSERERERERERKRDMAGPRSWTTMSKATQSRGEQGDDRSLPWE